ncbi:type VI secretion system amidase immunity protein Tai4 [Cupriavidus sp. SIMBA_020]|uniref:type VI secretion system amidase immunity protein Tai4 n=1 Tax=Cupriavidus sp. SIMBA_020 TaxID=3085766 RepID=UPI000FACEB53
MKRSAYIRLLLAAALAAGESLAKDVPVSRPQAAGRTYGQNYKDMVLAWCVATAYPGSTAASDAGSSVSALRDWTYYDMEGAGKAIQELVDRYLARDYFNLLAEAEVPGLKFQFLKCLDLYHSKELQEQVNRYVLKPRRTYRQDYSPTR